MRAFDVSDKCLKKAHKVNKKLTESTQFKPITHYLMYI